MDPTILAAVIGGLCALIAPILTYVLTRFFDNRHKLPISSSYRIALNSKWSGTVCQEQGPGNKPFDFPVFARINTTGKTIAGSATIHVDASIFEDTESSGIEEIEISFRGGFEHSLFLHINWIGVDSRQIQFGSTILELDALGERLSGRFVAYGGHMRQIVSGTMHLQRAS